VSGRGGHWMISVTELGVISNDKCGQLRCPPRKQWTKPPTGGRRQKCDCSRNRSGRLHYTRGEAGKVGKRQLSRISSVRARVVGKPRAVTRRWAHSGRWAWVPGVVRGDVLVDGSPQLGHVAFGAVFGARKTGPTGLVFAGT
jgi:hypothetical protein